MTLSSNDRENLASKMMELGEALMSMSERNRLDSGQTLRLIAAGVGQTLVGMSALLVDDSIDPADDGDDYGQMSLFKDA